MEDEDLKAKYQIPKEASVQEFSHIISFLFEAKLKEELDY